MIRREIADNWAYDFLLATGVVVRTRSDAFLLLDGETKTLRAQGHTYRAAKQT
jgi:hypothetical protein